MGQDQFANIAKIGAGRKSAIVVSARGGDSEASLLSKWLAIPTLLVKVDAKTHVNVLYSGKDKTIKVGYGNSKGYYIGNFQGFATD